jgi:hypothetical protein
MMRLSDMVQSRNRIFQLSMHRHRLLARRRRTLLVDRATNLFPVLIAGGLVVYGFLAGGWAGLLIALIAIGTMAVIYLASIWIYGAMARIFVRRAIRQMHAQSTTDANGIRADAWLIVGGNNLLVADAAKRSVLLHIRGDGWHGTRMHDIKRLSVVRQRTWLGRNTTVLTISDELAGPPLLEMRVVEGDADHFIKAASPRIGVVD